MHQLSVRQRFADSECSRDSGWNQLLLALLAVQHRGSGRRRAQLHGPAATQLSDGRYQRDAVPGPRTVGPVWGRVSVVLGERLHAAETAPHTAQSVGYSLSHNTRVHYAHRYLFIMPP